MKLRLDLRLSQKLIMTPQLQQAIKLLQLSRLELQQTLNQHLMENPLLDELAGDVDEGDPAAGDEWNQDKKEITGPEGSSDSPKEEDSDGPEELSASGWEDYFNGDRRAGDTEYPAASSQDELPSYDQTVVKPQSLEDHLLWQLALSGVSDSDKAIGQMIIGNLDEDGYLRILLEEVASDAKVSTEHAESVLRLIQSFDPPGVAARDLQECLLIQLGSLDRTVGIDEGRRIRLKGSVVEAIVTHHLKDLEKKHYARIAKALGVTPEEVFAATHVIEGLEPKPGRPYSTANNYAIVPDVFVVKNEGEWVVLLNDDGMPRLRISPYYKQLMSNSKQSSDATKAYLEEKLRGAQWIIRSIEQRNKTIIKVVGSIIKFQEQFFEKGVQYLKPLVLKQVAEDIGLHESTISRVTANKYMYCPQGILELKYFFNTGIQRSDQAAEELSSVTVREMIRKMVEEEDSQHPLKDQEIAARLQKNNILIARRTVAKYRSEVNIPSASQRKRFF
jgi:RNA polymerase sigma-54 factor